MSARAAPALLRVVEIGERSVQGRTQPFRCICEDGKEYFVKGRSAGRRSLICEWIAGHLAKSFGLPLPPFTIADVPAALVELHPEGGDLGKGPAFASQAISPVTEMGFAHLKQVPEQLRRDIAVFDWWVRNEDRSLTQHGGNPNLLWIPGEGKLFTIDHNLAFDQHFHRDTFLQTHVFASDFLEVVGDLADQGVYAQRLKQALGSWLTACDGVPPEWMYEDSEMTVPTDFDPDEALELLSGCATEPFWRVLE